MTRARPTLLVAALAAAFVLSCSDEGADAPHDAASRPDTEDAVTGDTDAGDSGTGDVDASSPDADDASDAPTYEPPPLEDLVQYVDPFIGTDGPGNVIPGALVPHGVVRASPVTNTGDGSIDAYEHGDGAYYGMAHMHLEGPGGSANGYGHVVVTPFAGALEDAPGRAPWTLDPEGEEAAPGWYAVDLPDGPRVEVTADRWAAAHRYTFQEDTAAGLVLDLSESRGRSIGGAIEAVGDGAFRGSARYDVHPAVSQLVGDGRTGRIEVYWAVSFDPAPDGFVTWQGDGAPAAEDRTGRDLSLAVGWPDDVRQVEVRIGLSLIDTANAEAHRDAFPGEFDAARAAASEAWNERLNRVRAEGDADELQRFYTALYHAMFQPADYSEDGRFASSWGGEVEVTALPDGRRYMTDDWCLWDTYRTSHPLRTLVEPDIVDDIVYSALHAYQQGGWLPKCPWAAAGYSRVMTGNPQVSIIADAVVKGFAAPQSALALEAVRHTSESDSNPFPDGLCGYFGLGTPEEYITEGYVPHECDPTQAASTTLELAHADWALARMAESLGAQEVATTYDARAESWRRHWDPEVGFMRGVMRDGSWVEPFDPTSMEDVNDFVEASSWIFSFFVPHDVPALIDLYGGDAAFVDRLETFFDEGYYDPSNQPSFHIPFLYAHAGRPERTQARVAEIRTEHFGNERDGLPGNDDAGSTSAWYVLAAMGLYPIAPGGPDYTITTPSLERFELILDPAHQAPGAFVVETEGSGPYIQEVRLDGELLDRWTVTHAEIVSGGRLTLSLGDAPPESGPRATESE